MPAISGVEGFQLINYSRQRSSINAPHAKEHQTLHPEGNVQKSVNTIPGNITDGSMIAPSTE